MERNFKAVFHPLSHLTDMRMVKGDIHDTRGEYRTMSYGETNFLYLVISAALFYHPNIYTSDGGRLQRGWLRARWRER